MKTKTHKRPRISIVTLGCSKNVYDSEVLMGQLRANDMEAAYERNNGRADIVVINTCGFIGNAKQESIDTILHYAEAKRSGSIARVIVTGCLSERYKNELRSEILDIDDWFGTHDLPALLRSLGADYRHELIGERQLATPPHFAYFKISEGCDRTCSFCAIPLMRGGHISRPMEDLVREARHLAAKGVKELILIAQDLTWYGLDLYKKRRLADLLRRISDVGGIEWIRLHYAFPSGFPMDVLDVMAERENICSYLDIPLQHTSDRLLKSMRRGITKAKTKDLVDAFRDRIPGIAIRTTLITGYPGETEGDFEEMKQWVQEMRFDRLGIFTYSHEEGTPAYALKDNVSAEVKQQRAGAIMAVQQVISLERNRSFIGTKINVLVDRKEGDRFIARTEYDSPGVDNEVLIPAGKNYCRIGDFAKVVIKDAEAYDLIAS